MRKDMGVSALTVVVYLTEADEVTKARDLAMKRAGSHGFDRDPDSFEELDKPEDEPGWAFIWQDDW
jgi:hypothetical protein